MRLVDTVALVTGAGSGIGRAIAELFAREGAAVVVADLRPERAQESAGRIQAAGGKALALAADVSLRDQVDRMAAQAHAAYGRVDVLVNNAALATGDDILHIEEEEWDLNLRVVLKSVYLCSKALLPGMIERRRGSIVNIASVNGLSGLSEEAYSAAKAGVINLTQNMAIKYGQHQVRANVICPGTVRTPIWGPILEKDPQIFAKLTKWYPLGRVGEPEDIARAALFLASEEAAWITGTTLTVDGGLMAGSYGMSRELMAKENEL
ncbi:MAG: glucose 1-dehydrogenase [Candidatus Latescibacteria bacterium]|nr:glucose 1-dehydrogenase [Candidatus Latescibacterota bacterium]